MSTPDPVDAYRKHRIEAYRHHPDDILEHYGTEGGIAQEYRGRLVYELLQNADDAMDDPSSFRDRVLFQLLDHSLLVANSGRPIAELDMRALCGLGLSSQLSKRTTGRRRATIGHKGMGFKSVLEVTRAPAVHSRGLSFQFDPDLAYRELAGIPELGDIIQEGMVSIMRLPFSVGEVPEPVRHALTEGYNTVFWLPLRDDNEIHAELAETLGSLDARTILFLRNIEEVVIDVNGEAARRWRLSRYERDRDGGWSETGSCPAQGTARVVLDEWVGDLDDEPDARGAYLISIDRDVWIGDHRGGLDPRAWRGVELTEVSAAVELDKNDRLVPITADPRIHVFLPTGERCPYPFLVNGAFSVDIKRQGLAVRTDDEDDYNRFLLRQAASLARDLVLSEASARGQTAKEVLALMDRRAVHDDRGEAAEPDSEASRALIAALCDALAGRRFVPVDDCGTTAAVNDLFLPPTFSDAPDLGPRLRQLVGPGRCMPVPWLCEPSEARILADLGSQRISLEELVQALELAAVDVKIEHGVSLDHDPVTDSLVDLWHALGSEQREVLQQACSVHRLLPVGEERLDGTVQRIAVGEVNTCFFPRQDMEATVPLPGVVFMTHGLCWGSLNRNERKDTLRKQLTAWRALWGVERFRFDAVFARAIRRHLRLNRDAAAAEVLRNVGVTAALCHIASERVNPGAPLVHERLGKNRTLFQLCRLSVPCRGPGGAVRWVPAYRAYFGRDWLGDASVEALLEDLPESHRDQFAPDYVLGPDRLVPELAKMRTVPTEEEPRDIREVIDEAEDDVDGDAPPDAPEEESWRHFLQWIGVNTHLRPIGLLDAEDRGSWTWTKDLHRSDGLGCLQYLSDEGWQRYRTLVNHGIRHHELTTDYRFYLYYVYDLEYLGALCEVIRENPARTVAGSLLKHLATHWSRLQPLIGASVATPQTTAPYQRNHGRALAWDHEIHEVAESPWVDRLRRRAWCPTGHGPRHPTSVWLPTSEVRRRFEVGRDETDVLLPAVSGEQAHALYEARGLARFLGIRGDLNPSTFEPSDCVAVFARLQKRFEGLDTISRRDQREIINPAYRHAIELMPPTQEERRTSASRAWVAATEELSRAPLLTHDGKTGYRFVPASEALHAERRDTRLRLGDRLTVWTFVLEGHPAARAPLREFFRTRILEEELEASPECDEHELGEDGERRLREEVARVAPYLICRVEADRATQRQIRRDATRLQRALSGLLPVGKLRVRYELGGEMTEASERGYHWQRGEEGRPARLIVSWGERAWPPTERVAEALAAGLCEAMQVNAFESFLALIRARGDAARKRLLVRASAPVDVDGKLALLASSRSAGGVNAKPGEMETPPAPAPETVEDEDAGAGEAATQPGAGDGQDEEKHVLWNPDDLVFDGEEEIVPGKGAGDGSPGGGGNDEDGKRRGGGRKSRRTDLSQLDRVGTALALRYERLRVRREWADATIFDLEDERSWKNARVFDVSNKERIAAARTKSEVFDRVMSGLTSMDGYGLDAEWPGFDILTLLPIRTAGVPVSWVDRMIELKSSTVQARKQEMTWNEWKTASDSSIAKEFWLYLVGNLRADLHGVQPYLQMVRDPFRSIRSRAVTEVSVRKKVDLYTSHFEEAVRVKLRAGGTEAQ